MERRHLPATVVAAAGFVALLARLVDTQLDSVPPLPATAVAFQLATILLYAGLTLALIAHLGLGEKQVLVFTALAFLVSGTLVVSSPSPDDGPVRRVATALLCGAVAAFTAAVIVHLAALIPRPEPMPRGRRRIVLAHYLGACVLGAVIASAFIYGVPRPPAEAVLVGHLVSRLNTTAYAWVGVVALVLLGTAARREPSLRGRRQALVVFCGVLPWTLVQAARLLLPRGLHASVPIVALESVVVLVVPVTMSLAIFGFRLFGLGVLARRSLIYGLTMGLPAGLLLAVLVATGAVTRESLAMRPSLLEVLVIGLLLVVALRPLSRWLTVRVDRVFFPEKVALRRLPREVIAELASLTDLDRAARHLVERIHAETAVAGVVVMIAEDGGAVFRVRAAAGLPDGNDAPLGIAVRGDRPGFARELPTQWSGSQIRVEGRELDASLAGLGPATLLPVRLGDRPVATLALGAPLAGAGFERSDLEMLRTLAEQVAAVLEHARVQELARIDPLTQLARRQVFLERLDEELARHRRSGRPLAVALVDVDDFKRVNDTLGHPAGDRVLRCVAEVLERNRRSSDLVARFGGEEFVVLLPECDLDDSVGVCDAMRRAVADSRVPVAEDVAVTVSIGVTVVLGTDAVDDLLVRADAALYRAKAAGKNRVEPG